MKHKVNNNRPWLDKVETLTIEADCTDLCRETVERVREEKDGHKPSHSAHVQPRCNPTIDKG